MYHRAPSFNTKMSWKSLETRIAGWVPLNVWKITGGSAAGCDRMQCKPWLRSREHSLSLLKFSDSRHQEKYCFVNCFLKSRPMSTNKTSSRPPLSATQTVYFLKEYHPGIICTNLSRHGYHHIAVIHFWGNCTIQTIDFPTDPPNFLSLPITNSKDTSFYL